MLVIGVAACSPATVPKIRSTAIDAPQTSKLGAEYAEVQRQHPDQSGVLLLETGSDALSARTALIERASRTIDLQYFIVREDATSQYLFRKLAEAADRGVRVRLLMDDIHKPREGVLAILAGHGAVELRVFNRFRSRGGLAMLWPFEFITDMNRLNRRMHNKVFIVDNQVAVIGGRNLGDEYFEAAPETDFQDLDLLAVGPVVRKASRSFDEYWNSEWTEVLPLKAGARNAAAATDPQSDTPFAAVLAGSPLANAIRSGQLDLIWARVVLVNDSPDKLDDGPTASDDTVDLPPSFIDLAEATKSELLIISAYFVPGKAGSAFLSRLQRSGVKVSVLTNSLATTDVVPVHGGYARYRPELLDAGVAMYELKPSAAPPRSKGRYKFSSGSSSASLHAKAVVFDGRWVYVGSLNVDPRSVWLNTESGLLVDSPVLSRKVVRWFERASRPASSYRVDCVRRDRGCAQPAVLTWTTVEQDNTVEYRSEPKAPVGRRVSASFWNLLPLDQHL